MYLLSNGWGYNNILKVLFEGVLNLDLLVKGIQMQATVHNAHLSGVFNSFLLMR